MDVYEEMGEAFQKAGGAFVPSLALPKCDDEHVEFGEGLVLLQ